ncbi:hypothetical protein D3C87_80540 [compost metagenome]
MEIAEIKKFIDELDWVESYELKLKGNCINPILNIKEEVYVANILTEDLNVMDEFIKKFDGQMYPHGFSEFHINVNIISLSENKYIDVEFSI